MNVFPLVNYFLLLFLNQSIKALAFSKNINLP